MSSRLVLRVASAGLVLIALLAVPALARATSGHSAQAPADTIVSSWQWEHEGGWTGTWTRRGTSDVFDVVYRGPSGQQITKVEELTVQGSQVRGRSVSSSDNFLCTLEGTMQPGGRVIEGTGACAGVSSGWWWKLTAKTVVVSPPAVAAPTLASLPADFPASWQWEHEGGWTGTWTRRGTSDVFDVVYRGPSGQQITKVEELTVQGSQVRGRSVSSSDNFACTLEGTMQPGGKVIEGTGACPGVNSGWWWKLTLASGAAGDSGGEDTRPPVSGTCDPGRANQAIRAGWYVANGGNPRAQEFALCAAAPAQALRVRIQGGEDDSGDGSVEARLYDPTGALVLSQKSASSDSGWDEWRVDLRSYGRYVLEVRDLDSVDGGAWPGNGGNVEVLFDVAPGPALAPPPPATRPPAPAAADIFLGDWLGAFHCADPANQMRTFDFIVWRENDQILWTDWSVPTISPASFSDEGNRFKLVTAGKDATGRRRTYTWYIDKSQMNPRAPLMEGESQFDAYPNCRRFRYVGMTHWVDAPARSGPPSHRPQVEVLFDGGAPPGETTTDWSTTAIDHRGQAGQRLDYRCPPAGSAGRIWGTDVYTDDSSVCTAAVHAGRISFASGGTVAIEIRPGQNSYQGSARNGVNSSAYGAWTGSFSFPGPTVPTTTPVARSLTGSWVHSMDPNFHTDDSRVIIIQDGSRVTMVRSAKYRGEWIVSKCEGTVSGNVLRADCDYSPGGNPFGFSATIETWTVSADGNHLDGTISTGQESHYSRIPAETITSERPTGAAATTAPAGVVPAGAHQVLTGRIDSSDAVRDDGSWYDGWTLQMSAGESVVITMQSPDFDTYLTVVSPSGAMTNDDDGGGGTNSRIQLTANEAGSWTIMANTFGSGETGSYTLTVDRR